LVVECVEGMGVRVKYKLSAEFRNEPLSTYRNVLQLPEGGDFEALHCQLSRNLDRSIKLDLTTEPPLLGRCCWQIVPHFDIQI